MHGTPWACPSWAHAGACHWVLGRALGRGGHGGALRPGRAARGSPSSAPLLAWLLPPVPVTSPPAPSLLGGGCRLMAMSAQWTPQSTHTWGLGVEGAVEAPVAE